MYMSGHKPRPHRALLDSEYVHLRRAEHGVDKFTELTIFIFALLVMFVVSTVYFSTLSILLGIAMVFAFLCLIALIYLLYALHKFRSDLKSHTYIVSGPLRKIVRISHDHILLVGKTQFRVSRNHKKVWDFFIQVEEGTHVEVVYSPRTKIIWTIRKVS